MTAALCDRKDKSETVAIDDVALKKCENESKLPDDVMLKEHVLLTDKRVRLQIRSDGEFSVALVSLVFISIHP
jgi:hypothetical protein